MEQYNKYPKGSEWRRWDLHVHTPFSYFNQFPSWDDYIEKLKEKAIEHNISVVGITDYFSIDGYEKLLDECEAEDKKSTPHIKLSDNKNLFVLPIIEIRLDNFTSDNSAVNLHIIFSPQILPATIRSNFLENLDIMYSGVSLKCKESDLIKIGYAEANSGRYDSNLDIIQLSEEQRKDYKKKALSCITFSSSNFNEKLEKFEKDIISSGIKRTSFIIIIANKGHGSLAGFNWQDVQRNTSRAGIIRQNLLWNSDICFTNDENDKKFLLGKMPDTSPEEILGRFKSFKPCIWGSDAHDVQNLFHPSNGATHDYTWIKADPTFEGLKQIIYEPEIRAKIQESNPQYDFRKSSFNKLQLGETSILRNSVVHFERNEIPLNPNLVSIIGGRGTGKSLLLDVLAKTFSKNKRNDRIEDINKDLDFKISYSKPDDSLIDFSLNDPNNDLDYLHVHQSEIKEVVKNSDLLDEQIKRMLNITEQVIEQSFDSKSENLISNIFDTLDWNQQTDDQGSIINSISYNTGQKLKIQGLVSTLTTEEYKNRIDQFIGNNNEIAESESLQQKLRYLRKELESFSLIQNQTISELNQGTIPDETIPSISFEAQNNIIDTRVEKLQETIRDLNNRNKEIKDDFIGIGISEDISTLLQKIKAYQKDIKFYDNKINESTRRNDQLNIDIKDLSNLYSEMIEILKSLKGNINSSWDTLKTGKEGWTDKQISLLNKLLKDINIKAVVKFDVNKFYYLLQPCLSGNKFKATRSENSIERIKNTIGVQSLYDYIHLISNKKIITIDNNKIPLSEFIKKDYFNLAGDKEFLQKLYLSNYRNEYLKVIAEITYKNKLPHQISVGQRGTMFICLQLATDPFIKPFVYDQPEDDLDNNFIMTDLVPIFREIKQYRQVIIVTHNANLVVNADAEQIIVANNNNERIEYVSGALEHNFSRNTRESNLLLQQGIREHVCDILEGGEIAFEKREQKYGFA